MIIREAGHDSAVGRYALGDAHGWQASEHLLASILDATNGLLWQGSGGKSGEKPKPVPRPDISRRANTPNGKDDSFGAQVFGEDFEMDAVSLDEIQAWLGIDIPA